MYGDPHRLRLLAARLHEDAADLHAAAHRLERGAGLVPWSGLAGDAMRARVRAEAAAQRRTADLHDAAAAALSAHAAQVERQLAAIARVEHEATTLVGAARHRVSRFLDGLTDAVDPRDEVLARTRLPGHGSVEWLRLRLPGGPGR